APALSADGRTVVFASAASNLVPGDTNGRSDVFVRDLVDGITTRASVTSGGAQTDGDDPWDDYELQLGISADGQVVTFTSIASDLVADDPNPGDLQHGWDVFAHDRASGATELVSRHPDDGPFDDSVRPSISADGRYVAFLSAASNLVPGDSSDQDAFV